MTRTLVMCLLAVLAVVGIPRQLIAQGRGFGSGPGSRTARPRPNSLSRIARRRVQELGSRIDGEMHLARTASGSEDSIRFERRSSLSRLASQHQTVANALTDAADHLDVIALGEEGTQLQARYRQAATVNQMLRAELEGAASQPDTANLRRLTQRSRAARRVAEWILNREEHGSSVPPRTAGPQTQEDYRNPEPSEWVLRLAQESVRASSSSVEPTNTVQPPEQGTGSPPPRMHVTAAPPATTQSATTLGSSGSFRSRSVRHGMISNAARQTETTAARAGHGLQPPPWVAGYSNWEAARLALQVATHGPAQATTPVMEEVRLILEHVVQSIEAQPYKPSQFDWSEYRRLVALEAWTRGSSAEARDLIDRVERTLYRADGIMAFVSTPTSTFPTPTRSWTRILRDLTLLYGGSDWWRYCDPSEDEAVQTIRTLLPNVDYDLP